MLPFDERVAAAAQLLPMADLEDACVAATAFGGSCDIIATRNTNDFTRSPIPAKTPDEILMDI